MDICPFAGRHRRRFLVASPPFSHSHILLQLLHVVETFVVAAEGEELLVGSALHDAAFVEHAYFVGVFDGREAVGNGYGGARLHEAFEGFLHETFALRVERRGGLVEDENGGVLQYGARYGDALALSARETAAAVAHLRVVALFAFHDELVGVSYLGSFHHLLHGGVFHTEGYVVEERVVEEYGLLVYVAYEGTQGGDGKRLHVFAVNENFAASDVVVAGQKVHERGLSRTALAYEGYGLSAFHAEADVAEHGGALVVGEAHVAELYAVFQCINGDGVGGFADGVYGVENFVHTFHRSHAFRYAVRGFGEVLQRLDDAVEDDHVEDERGGIDGGVVGEDECAAVPEDEHDECGAEELAHGVGRRLAYGHTVRGVAEVVCGAVEAARHLLFGAESLDDAHAAERFLKLCHGVAPLVLGVEALVLEFAAYASHHPSHEGEHHDGEYRELPRGVDEHPEVADEEDGVLYEHVERTGDGVFYLVYVAAHAGYDVALALIGEEAEGERENLVVDAGAYVADYAGAEGHHDAYGGKVTRGLQQRGGDEEQADEEQRGGGAVLVHELRGVPVHVVHHNLFHAYALCAPGDEDIVVAVYAEEELEHGYERHEREYVEHCGEEVEEERTGEVGFIGTDILPHYAEEFFHVS